MRQHAVAENDAHASGVEIRRVGAGNSVDRAGDANRIVRPGPTATSNPGILPTSIELYQEASRYLASPCWRLEIKQLEEAREAQRAKPPSRHQKRNALRQLAKPNHPLTPGLQGKGSIGGAAPRPLPAER
jgi:hypothetical protein